MHFSINFKHFSRVMPMAFTLLLISYHVRATNFEPAYFYTTSTGNTTKKFTSPDESFADYQSYLAATATPSRHFVALGQYPDPNTKFINGKPTTYLVDIETYEWGVLKGTDAMFLTGLNIECARSHPKLVANDGKAVPNNWTRISYYCENTDVEPDLNSCQQQVGNPINLASGFKLQTETDYRASGASTLEFTRTYRSDRMGWGHNFRMFGIDFTSIQSALTTQNADWPDGACYPGIGVTTGKPYCFKYMTNGNANNFAVQRGNGRLLNFGTAVDLNPAIDINDRATKVTDGAGVVTNWTVYNADNETTELYDLTGRLQTIANRNGQVTTMVYSDSSTPKNIAPKSGLLVQVTDSFGRQIAFTYDAQGRMITMTDPSGGIYSYTYDEATSIVLPGQPITGNLTSVTYPDQSKRIYWYNEQDKTGNTNLPFALTGITDENGARFATWYYNAAGKAVSSEHANGVDKYSIGSYSNFGQRTVTDPLGALRTYYFQTVLGVLKVYKQSQPGGSGCGAASNAITYDANGNVASRTDWNGNKTTFTYDLFRNLETKRVEASGMPQARTISTAWHATYRFPTKIAEPKRLTTNNYDAKGNLLTRTVQETADANGAQGFGAALVGPVRIWSYTYNEFGQLLTATDPDGGVTRHSYDTQGNLTEVTNALGHVTTLSNYDANGRVGRIVDPNGLTTNLSYSPRGWLTSRTVGEETTTYDYDNAGQLKKVTLPDGSSIHYTYDDAHRLTDIADSLGNRVVYTLDAMGNRIKEEVKDPGGALARQTTRVYDALNRLQQVTGAQP